jgi:F-type H+-transporting ATPase subunit epsilon
MLRYPHNRPRRVNLKVLIPFEIFAQKSAVLRIVAETQEGSFGLLPHRLDCAAALAPGILTFETEAEGTAYIAVDEGVLVKAGDDVLVSVRRAIGGKDLAQLQEAVQHEFIDLDAEQRTVRAALAKIESGLIARFAEFQRER